MTCGDSRFFNGAASTSFATCPTTPKDTLEKGFLKPTMIEIHPDQKQTIGTSNLEAPGFHPKSPVTSFTGIKII